MPSALSAHIPRLPAPLVPLQTILNQNEQIGTDARAETGLDYERTGRSVRDGQGWRQSQAPGANHERAEMKGSVGLSIGLSAIGAVALIDYAIG
jgi:hypothetical protein